ncbi:unnamed protein product [Miscanthus lutarioriparius]|uniref:Uncharacterized protein n=1 Tax=Miscanthus lutarioriparius TaxID=422564 RepID=A0A811S9K0_9POAL|nr:unnamed protein product [Miscanthus lutarioriparius]
MLFMDDSTAEETRNRKRARLTPSAGDVVDQISGLELLGDARDAVRMSALSRRWLGLWKRVATLSFISWSVWEATDVEECAALMQYVSSINDALALCTQSGCAIERLAISYTRHSPHPDDPYQDDMPPASVNAFRNGVGGIRDPDGERYLERLMPASVDAIQGWIW